MKVFISWSGERSRRVAELLHTWIECVIQAVEPWVSSSDIDRGALWFTQIIDELSTTTHGIICLTRENKEKPWILFEAGALAKGLASSRIYTLLVDLNPEDIRDPLAQFNHTRPNEAEMFRLVSSINKGLDSNRLKESVLASAFKTYWPQFEEAFKKIIDETEETTLPKETRPQEDVLTEILNAVRGINKRVRAIENDKAARPAVKFTFADAVERADEVDVTRETVPVEQYIIGLMSRGVSYREVMDLVRSKYNIPSKRISDIINEVLGKT